MRRPVASENSAGREAGGSNATQVVVAAAIAMAATLPGRTHGLGLITTRLLDEFPSLGEVGFARINFVATLAGSLFCLPCGWWLDRRPMREVAAVVTASLACAVLGLAVAPSAAWMAIAVTATRGIGQSMLSIVSLALIGKAFPHRPGAIMGAYAVVMTMLMAVGTWGLGEQVTALGWRGAWWRLGLGLLGLAPLLGWLAPRATVPHASAGESVGGVRAASVDSSPSATLSQALRTPCFWTFAIGVSLFGLASSGVSLFQQSILAEHGLGEELYHRSLVVGLVSGLVANLGFGWLATRWALHRLLALSLFGLAGSLACLPRVDGAAEAYAFCIAYSAAGGGVTVMFFTVWSHAFGLASLARIQGAAQMLTVIASALGPLLVTEGRARTGSFDGVLWGLAALIGLCGAASAVAIVPSAATGCWRRDDVTNPETLRGEKHHDGIHAWQGRCSGQIDVAARPFSHFLELPGLVEERRVSARAVWLRTS